MIINIDLRALGGLTPIISNMELTHLGYQVSIYLFKLFELTLK